MQQTSDMKHFTRGGQIILHNFRMFTQIMNKVMLFSVLLFMPLALGLFFYQTTDYERYVFSEFGWSKTIPILEPHAKTLFIQPNGSKIAVKYADIANSKKIQQYVGSVSKKILLATLVSMLFSMITMIFISFFVKKWGEKQSEDVLLKGDKILQKEVTKKFIQRQELASDINLANLPLIKNTETAHLLFHGTVGSGKSNAIKELLDQIRKRGDRAIIYDKSCNFLEEFYQPDHDILLNPLDSRGKTWDLWQECRDSADFDSLAAAQIPMISTQDPFWVNAARTIFASAAFEMRNDPKRSIKKLLQTLLTADLGSIQRYLKGTEAETLVSDKIEKTAVSIKSVLATYLKSLKYITEGDGAFSIRNWIRNEQSDQWLFITSLGDRHETLRPLITAWLDIAVNSLLSLTPDQNRRIWVITDEFASLYQLPSLIQAIAEGRKFGVCFVMGIQNYAQLARLYGHDGAREISSLINTRFMFRQPDPDIAKWSASNLGETFIDEVREGTSYGANTIRDGVSINRVEIKKQVVSYSEVMSLANLYAYVRLPGQFPITLVDFIYKSRKRVNAGFIARPDFDDKGLKSGDEWLDQYDKPAVSPIKKASKKKKGKEKIEVKELLDITNPLSTEFDFEV